MPSNRNSFIQFFFFFFFFFCNRYLPRIGSASGGGGDLVVNTTRALVGVERYAALANVKVDHLILNALLLFAICLVVTVAVMTAIAWCCRKRHNVPGFVAAKGVGYAFQVSAGCRVLIPPGLRV